MFTYQITKRSGDSIIVTINGDYHMQICINKPVDNPIGAIEERLLKLQTAHVQFFMQRTGDGDGHFYVLPDGCTDFSWKNLQVQQLEHFTWNELDLVRLDALCDKVDFLSGPTLKP